MKKLIIATLLSVFPLFSYANPLYLADFATAPATQKVYSALIAKAQLPAWVKQGGTGSPAIEVEVSGVKYQVMSGCKPHNCPSQQFAVMYAPQSHQIYAVYAQYHEKNATQELRWLNVGEDQPVDIRTVLFARLSGSLENHPEQFNFH
ncbi:hypothetical protein BL250_13105 [Erwinia sp. OLTSP20]|uniref:Ivy family c-type lysozyme inhibitor n=1 Tax=unclassified Erwinia TaxID=2622719 RepID=UPI000C19FF6F|nr:MULTISPECIES: Ivy family c-type lysozyme inhibitor [unclassified Erwinia]PIJ49417.1 hypothetical protein BV501_12940 [Erwinia sp. OAMSP11]PIJ71093.1 hypothetical protein BK416_12125 [Erwinia sp. OLSSP12]PIJ79371.1 hypothetical protein BLD47_14455 [Erwinia sp. OLCASP19]PIJ80909.1 hypothetical protein BLD46_13705 [Erwinia sp. OLMTSP26]PIJ83711.1 hypothetical protein BLD49_12985 [Erwinia sp. OLMDSP33]